MPDAGKSTFAARLGERCRPYLRLGGRASVTLLAPMVGDHARLLALGRRRLWPAWLWARRRLSGETGQDVVEYAGVLVLVAAIVAAVASLNLSGAITRAVSCEIKQITTGGCTLAAAPVPGGSAPGPAGPSTASGRALALGERQTEQILGSNRLIFACAGTGRTELGSDRAAQSQACQQQLAKLSPKAISTLELLAALFQTEHDYKAAAGPPCTDAQAAALASCAETKQQFFALLLADYTGHPGDAVIALSRAAQQLQSGPILRNEKIESTQGDLLDGFLGSLCGGYGICLGGTTLSQAYQQAYHASAAISKITTPIAVATGVAGALKGIVLPGLRAALTRFGVGTIDAQRVEQAATELEGANGTATARQLGRQGESVVPGTGNTARIPSATGTANYRIPDILDPEARVIGEVKNVSKLSLTAQLRDFIAYAQEHGYDFELYVRRTTKLSGPLKQAVTSGQITLRYLP